jgi:hypothetical protein
MALSQLGYGRSNVFRFVFVENPTRDILLSSFCTRRIKRGFPIRGNTGEVSWAVGNALLEMSRIHERLYHLGDKM